MCGKNTEPNRGSGARGVVLLLVGSEANGVLTISASCRRAEHLRLRSGRSTSGIMRQHDQHHEALGELAGEDVIEVVKESIKEGSRRNWWPPWRQFIGVNKHKAVFSVKLLDYYRVAKEVVDPTFDKTNFQAAKIKRRTGAGERKGRKAFVITTRIERNKWMEPS